MYGPGGGWSGAEIFATATHEIAEYSTTTYKGAGELHQVMDSNTLVFKVLVDPAATPPPDGAGITMVEIWILSLK